MSRIESPIESRTASLCRQFAKTAVALTAMLSSTNTARAAQVPVADPPVSSPSSSGATIVNSGFEKDFNGWKDIDPSAISRSDVHTGSKSAKITGAGGRFDQSVSVATNTSYTLTAWVLGRGSIGVQLGSKTIRKSGDYSRFTKVSLSFASGANTAVTVFGEYNGGTGRFDDFALQDAGLGNAVPPVITMLPSHALDLRDWKITIPFDAQMNDGAGAGTALEIKQPQLRSYALAPFFLASPDERGVIFRAHAGGATTSGSGYPRCELREMRNGGTTKASWSSSSGKHTMIMRQAVNALPVAKPHVVAGQIHDGSDDVFTFRIERKNGKNLIYITFGNGKLYPAFEPDYRLGTPFEAKFVVDKDVTRFFYNGQPVRVTLNGKSVDAIPHKFSGAYFKAGCYTQSSCHGSKKVAGEACGAYAEVQIFDLEVTHQ